MTLDSIIKKTAQYVAVPSVIRHEEPFANMLCDEFSSPSYELERTGNLLAVRRKGSSSPKVITAHIDRHGLVVNDQGEFEYSDFNARKFYGDPVVSGEALFKKAGQRMVGTMVKCYDSLGMTLDVGQVAGYEADFDKKRLVFHVDGMSGLKPGTPVGYVSHLSNEDGKLSSQIDNAISVAVARQLMEDGFDGTLVLAPEEEIGRSWKHIVDYLDRSGIKEPQIYVIDVTPYEDEKAIDDGLVALRNRDELGEFDPQVVERLKAAIPGHVMKDEYILSENQRTGKDTKLGKTELGRMVQHTQGRYNGATIQLPVLNYHSNKETTTTKALGNYYDGLKTVLG